VPIQCFRFGRYNKRVVKINNIAKAKNGNLRQAYGDHDSKPADDIMIFIEGEWLPFAKEKIKELRNKK